MLYNFGHLLKLAGFVVLREFTVFADLKSSSGLGVVRSVWHLKQHTTLASSVAKAIWKVENFGSGIRCD
jgi:hypothetical protein